MIFGFNTDIKYENTVYHVQSEAREGERLLQTQIFVRGRCMGKKAASYVDLLGRPEFSEERMHEMLKLQHRTTIDDIRNGRVDAAMTHVTPLEVLLAEMTQTSPMNSGANGASATAAATSETGAASATAPAPAKEVEPAATPEPGLELEFLNPDAVVAHDQLVLQFRVVENRLPVSGATIIARLTKIGRDGLEHDPVYAQGETGADGQGATSLAANIADMTHAVVLVQATHNGQSAMKKFRLKSPK